jgi:hypothetical protein
MERKGSLSTQARLRQASPPSDEDEKPVVIFTSGSQESNKTADSHTGMSQEFEGLSTSPKFGDAPTLVLPERIVTRQYAAADGYAKIVKPTSPTGPMGPTSPVKPTKPANQTKPVRPNTKTTPAINDDPAPAAPNFKSFASVCVVKRPSDNKKKDIKLYALQNTFYAYPIDTSADVKTDIHAKINEVSVNFDFQKYETEIYEFGLPFEVEEVCKISAGYGTAPKKHKIAATPGAKRKKAASSSSSSSEDEDIPSSPEISATPAKKSRR